jgi:hypothetical protein
MHNTSTFKCGAKSAAFTFPLILTRKPIVIHAFTPFAFYPFLFSLQPEMSFASRAIWKFFHKSEYVYLVFSSKIDVGNVMYVRSGNLRGDQ